MEEYPDTVYITDESGKRGYCLDKEKSSKNVTSDPRLSFLHTAYLSKHPLVVDSLYENGNCIWSSKVCLALLHCSFWYPIKMKILQKVYTLTLFTWKLYTRIRYYGRLSLRGWSKRLFLLFIFYSCGCKRLCLWLYLLAVCSYY